MKRFWMLTLTLILAACTSPNPTQAVQSLNTETSQLPTLQPTALPSATPTSAPTNTPVPPPPSPITPGKLSELSEIYRLPIEDIREIKFLENGEDLGVTSGNQENFGAYLVNTVSGEITQTYQPYDGIVWGLDISKDDLWLVTASNSQSEKTITVWNLMNNSLATWLKQPIGPNSVAFSPDGSVLAVGGINTWPEGEIWLYEVNTWTPLDKLDAQGQNVLALEYSPDGNMLISAGTDGKIRVWNPKNGSLVQTLFYARQANNLAFSPGGELLASTFCDEVGTSGCTKGGVVVWRTSDWSILQIFPDLAETVTFSADGQLMVTGSGNNDPIIRFRRTIDWSTVYTINESSNALAFNYDGSRFASANWTEIKIYTIKNGPSGK